MTVRPVCLGMIIVWAFLSVPVLSQDNNGPWTPEQSKTADHKPGTPSDPRGFYPPIDSKATKSSDSKPTPAAPAPTPTPAPYPKSFYNDNNGPWTPDQSKTADHKPGTPSDPRGFYPPITGSPNDKPANLGDDLADLGAKIATSNLANPLIQGGKAIGRTYEASERGDTTGVMIEATDGVGRLAAIGLGAGEGAALGTTFGPIGTAIGGIIGGFLGNAGWNATGGALNESSRQMHDQAQQQARDQAQQVRDIAVPRPSGGGGGGGGGCGGPCGR
jgi:hypothetical protein